MTPSDLARAGEALYGRDWRAPLARDLGCSRRYVVAWATGERPVTEHYACAIRSLMRSRGAALVELANTLDAKGGLR